MEYFILQIVILYLICFIQGEINMTWGNNKDLHKYPKGFKQKLAIYYHLTKPMCVLCWSQTRVAIHHYTDTINTDKNLSDRCSYIYQYRNKRIKPDWSDLSKFVLLCGSCHSKIHSTINFSGVRNGKKAPILILLNDIIEKHKLNLKD